MDEFSLVEQQVRIQYKLLKHEGYYTRVRWDDKQTKEAKGEETYVKGVEEVLNWARPRCGKYNLYISRNPFTSQGRVAGISAVTFDLDIIRESGSSTTSIQIQNALKAGSALTNYLGERNGHIGISGNGALVILPFDKLVTEDVEQFAKKAQQFENEVIKDVHFEGIRIDHTNYAKAVVKLMGSVSTKGEKSNWRYARLVSNNLVSTGSSKIRERIEEMELPLRESTFEGLQQGTNFPSRSEADYTLALYAKRGGLGPDAARQLLQVNPFGRRSDTRDQQRILTKVYSQYDNGNTTESKFTVYTPSQNFKEYQEQRNHYRGGKLIGISSGFKWLDNHLSGYRDGNVYCVQAITNAGKSVFIVQTAHEARKQSKRVLLITTEMGRNEVYSRYLAIGSSVPASKIDSGVLDSNNNSRLTEFETQFKQDKGFFILESSSPQSSLVEDVIKEVQPDIVLIDYFQHVDTGSNSRTVELATLARGYEAIAKKFQLPILIAAQLHEYYDFKTHKRIPSKKTDVKDCKVINDIASAIIVLDWCDIDNDDGMVGVPVKMTIEKNRHGPRNVSQIIKLDRQIPKFVE